MDHTFTRVRHELKRRRLSVHAVERLTPNMLRITFVGADLADFISAAPDDHVKLFFPTAAGTVEMRDFTPRYYNPHDERLVIDFALHQAGPAVAWAKQASVGQTLEIGGPRGSFVVSDTFDWWLLIGDETALPAIGRRIETLSGGTQILSLITVTGSAEEQSFSTQAQYAAHWVHRPAIQANDPAPLLAALAEIVFPSGDGFVFIAAEAGVARAVRDFVVTQRQHPKQWLKAAGYWRYGQADAHERLED